MSTNPYATRIEYVDVNGRQVATDQEGYIQNMDDWSEEYALALAKKESL
ncbi:MAG: TusE/DsrC/DsvC family sulfur relay protein, partial [Candidatus Sedimenticola sp. (ex Thyasira tokunagai)]